VRSAGQIGLQARFTWPEALVSDCVVQSAKAWIMLLC